MEPPLEGCNLAALVAHIIEWSKWAISWTVYLQTSHITWDHKTCKCKAGFILLASSAEVFIRFNICGTWLCYESYVSMANARFENARTPQCHGLHTGLYIDMLWYINLSLIMAPLSFSLLLFLSLSPPSLPYVQNKGLYMYTIPYSLISFHQKIMLGERKIVSTVYTLVNVLEYIQWGRDVW